MEEQKRGLKVIYKNEECFIDVNLEQFRDIRENYPPTTPIKIFAEAPFYNENAKEQVPITRLVLVVNNPEEFTDSGMSFFKKLISLLKTISCTESDTCIKWQHIISGAMSVIETLSEKEKTDRLEVIYYIQTLLNKKDYGAMLLNYPAG